MDSFHSRNYWGRGGAFLPYSRIFILNMELYFFPFILHFKSQPNAPNDGTEHTGPLTHEHRSFSLGPSPEGRHRVQLIKLPGSALSSLACYL